MSLVYNSINDSSMKGGDHVLNRLIVEATECDFKRALEKRAG
jgi:hypothetical protein